MKLAFEYGFADQELADIVNRRLATGWYLFAPPEYHWTKMSSLYLAFIFCDEESLALYDDTHPPAFTEIANDVQSVAGIQKAV